MTANAIPTIIRIHSRIKPAKMVAKMVPKANSNITHIDGLRSLS